MVNQDEINNCYCPLLIEEDWDEQEKNWIGKQFFVINYKSWLYKPKEDLTKKITDAHKKIVQQGYGSITFGLTLYQAKMFRGEILIEIKNGDINDPQVKTFQGYVHTKTYFGPVKDLTEVAKTFDFKPVNVYVARFSCPVCTPDRNKQKSVLIAEKPFV